MVNHVSEKDTNQGTQKLKNKASPKKKYAVKYQL